MAAATGQPHYQKQWQPLAPGFVNVPYNDIESIKSATNDKYLLVDDLNLISAKQELIESPLFNQLIINIQFIDPQKYLFTFNSQFITCGRRIQIPHYILALSGFIWINFCVLHLNPFIL